jgi:hypothetical protein
MELESSMDIRKETIIVHTNLVSALADALLQGHTSHLKRRGKNGTKRKEFERTRKADDDNQ